VHTRPMPRRVPLLALLPLAVIVTACMGGGSSDEVTIAAAARPPTCSAEDTAQGRSVSDHRPPGLIRHCGRGHATVRFRGKTYELTHGYCTEPKGTSSRWIQFGLHRADGPSGEGELALVLPGNRSGRVAIEDGEIAAGGVWLLPHFWGGTAFVAAGMTGGTFRVMATLGDSQGRATQKRELVSGNWDCG
jgi:hypothetical protein